MTVLDSRGRPVPVGSELGRGGEGAVFAVADRPPVVAKLYHQPVGPEQAAKLTAMVRRQSERLLRLAAWPMDTLHERPGGPVVGLLMPKVVGYRPIHHLYSPKARRVEFPNAGWPFCIHTATNVARAFAVVHEHGHVIGDVNHGNAVVSDRATVMLIDCDSFQVAAGRQRFLCEVGVSTHQPPELQGLASFRGVVRTANHDNFGLAVLIFQILLMGRHPFAGTYLGSGDMAIEQAIKEYRFAYGRAAVSRQMRPPPHTLPLAVVSWPLAALFERAFAPEGAQDGRRPGAREWVTGLEDLAQQLKRCGRNAGHSYLTTLPDCPWCALAAATGVAPFASTVVDPAPPARTLDLAAVWAEIAAVAGPEAAPAPPPEQLPIMHPSERARRLGRIRRMRLSAAAVVVILGAAGWLLGFPFAGDTSFLDFAAPTAMAWLGLYCGTGAERDDKTREVAALHERWSSLRRLWPSETGDQAFRAKLRELERARHEYLARPVRHQRTVSQLQTDRRFRQLHHFLDQHQLTDGVLAGIGPGREATLRSFGVESAADVTPEAIQAIPGFGRALANQLVEWRRQLEQGFVYDPTKDVDPADVDQLAHDPRAAHRRLEQTLLGGATRLRQLTQETLRKRQSLRSELEQIRLELARAEADLAAM